MNITRRRRPAPRHLVRLAADVFTEKRYQATAVRDIADDGVRRHS